MQICTAEQMREIDRLAIEGHGLPGVVLMEAAGRGVVERMAALRSLRGAKVALLCGVGNNGGDGFVIARHLISRGAEAITWLIGPADAITGDAAINYQVLKKMRADMRSLRDEVDLDREAKAVLSADFVVDALFGTGLTRDVGGQFRRVIELANRSQGLRIAVDIPSGLDANTGAVLGVAFAADHTVTFGYPKIGLVTHPGVHRCGTLHLVDIGIPSTVEQQASFCGELLTEPEVAGRLLDRPAWGHKGTYGHLLVVAGSLGKTGAGLLCAEAALRSGIGLCTIAAPSRAASLLEGRLPEAMVEPLFDETSQTLDDSDDCFARFGALLAGKSAVALGPGLARGSRAAAFVARLVRESLLPVVIDADGLNDLAEDVSVLDHARAPLLLTPHPGEMARLLDCPVEAIQRDRVGAATELSVKHGVLVALKGARTVVADPHGRAYINPTGNSGMGSAGMGDALTGLVGGFLAQRHDPLSALILGVFVHGAAGDAAAHRVGRRSLLAGDLIASVSEILKSWE